MENRIFYLIIKNFGHMSICKGYQVLLTAADLLRLFLTSVDKDKVFVLGYFCTQNVLHGKCLTFDNI